MSKPSDRNPVQAGETTEDGALAEEFLLQIGFRIRRLRTCRGLTVQQLADLADVSRRLLTQIEHGQANPSLVAVTRIARGLDTDFTELIGDASPSEAAVELIPAADHHLVWSSAAGSTAHLLVSTAGVRAADLWSWVLVSGDSYGGLPDPPGSFELFHVIAGVLTLVADGTEVAIAAGDSGRLRSDRAYRYLNTAAAPAVFLRTVALGR